ncbi:hypothetical protein PC116_g22169 [Phytophthora cactorum]|uniref:Uncharacterized protein n=1 Tax=Phytophthora cactorum TaxID=29920 RepID=A0A8T1K2N0_9STRA|nr:hypothetical protein PC111_g4569 [Phytophthora cactorum]KAG2942220.1 hypothetical protein PC117_g9900 [Phytophthora cactorum]KAG3130460.1 hypothetical protein C6341_g23739 [Phytophthora cactorum]KAG4055409.1 hypothetical protein PC123_g9507 [Phytophthora cactorum]KAG4229505.1 hypothetical protein PC116_g22169 [Phytophthora cactorum]
MKDRRKKVRKTQVKGKQTAYEARKEVKRDLVEKVKNLQKELGQLKFRLLHLVRAAMQAALTGHAQRSLDTLEPVQSVICLGTDQVERYNTLMALKERQLANAERHLAARSRGLSPRSTYCQEECFDSAEGDYCVVRFETVPVWGAHSKEVFDAMLGSVLNQEIILSEMFGCVAIHEDNDSETSEFTRLRLVTATSAETTVESYTLLFSRFSTWTEKAATELWPQTSWILTLCIRIGPMNASGETEPGSLFFFKRYKVARSSCHALDVLENPPESL